MLNRFGFLYHPEKAKEIADKKLKDNERFKGHETGGRFVENFEEAYGKYKSLDSEANYKAVKEAFGLLEHSTGSEYLDSEFIALYMKSGKAKEMEELFQSREKGFCNIL